MKPNTEQLARLRAYAKAEGKYWKESLSADWANGTDDSLTRGFLLRQLRNNFGPEWLATFELPPVSVEEAMLPLRQALRPQGTLEVTMLRLNSGCAVKAWLVEQAIDEIIRHHTDLKPLGEPESACMQLTKILLNDSAYRS